MQTLVYYKELDQNTDRPFLLAHTQAFDNVYSRPSMSIKDLVDLVKLNEQLKQRLEMPKEPELIYKLASVVFFDQHENPDVYEFSYAAKKIQFWKKEVDLEAFFLSKPLRQLVPYLEHADENLSYYSKMAEKATGEHLAFLSTLLSPQQNGALLTSRSWLDNTPVSK